LIAVTFRFAWISAITSTGNSISVFTNWVPYQKIIEMRLYNNHSLESSLVDVMSRKRPVRSVQLAMPERPDCAPNEPVRPLTINSDYQFRIDITDRYISRIAIKTETEVLPLRISPILAPHPAGMKCSDGSLRRRCFLR
jgi:hypothetical protein